MSFMDKEGNPANLLSSDLQTKNLSAVCFVSCMRIWDSTMATIPRIFFRKISSTPALKAAAESAGTYHQEADKARELWKKITFFVALPAIAIASANCYVMEISHHHERPEFVPYEHLRIRHKGFFWGDGNHSFFHHKELNALPSGYED